MAKPENERREEIVNRIATAAMVCVTPHLKHMISFNTLCEAVSAALPPLPQQGDIAQRESGGDEPVAWRWRKIGDPEWQFFSRGEYPPLSPPAGYENEPLYAAPPGSPAMAEPVGDGEDLVVEFERAAALFHFGKGKERTGAERRYDAARANLVVALSGRNISPVAWAYWTDPEREDEPTTEDGDPVRVATFDKHWLPQGRPFVALYDAPPAPAEAQARVEALEAALREMVGAFASWAGKTVNQEDAVHKAMLALLSSDLEV